MLVVLPLTRFKLKELKLLCSVNITPLWHYVYDDDDKDSECFLITLSMHRDFNPLRKRWSTSWVVSDYNIPCDYIWISDGFFNSKSCKVFFVCEVLCFVKFEDRGHHVIYCLLTVDISSPFGIKQAIFWEHQRQVFLLMIRAYSCQILLVKTFLEDVNDSLSHQIQAERAQILLRKIAPLWQYDDDDKDSECFLITLHIHRDFNPLGKRWSTSCVWLRYSLWLYFNLQGFFQFQIM